MKIKKLLAGGLAAALAGATITFGVAATLADYVDAPINIPKIVIGSDATSVTQYPKDVAAAGDIGAAMAGYATTETVISGGAITGVSGGADIATTSKKLYFRSLINRARGTLTATHLPTILASGTADTDKSETYNYDQYINIGARTTTYGTNSDNFDDPTLYVDMGYNAVTTPFYNVTIVFSRAINVSDDDVRGGSVIFADNTYIIGAESGDASTPATGNKLLVLLSGAATESFSTDDGEIAVTISGVSHTMELESVSSDTLASLTIDGITKDVTEKQTKTYSGVVGGALNVYIKRVSAVGNTGGGSIEVVLGADKIQIQDAKVAKQGVSDLTEIKGTRCFVTADAAGISKIVVSVSGADTNSNYVIGGEANAFTDPVFGSFSVAFDGMTPTTDSELRDTITINDLGDTKTGITVTDFRGNEKTITYAYNGTTQPQLNWTIARAIHVLEGETVSLNDYVLIAPEQESDFGHMLQLTEVDEDVTNPKFVMTDVFTGTALTFYFDGAASNAAWTKTFYIDGQTYYAYNISGTDKLNITWGDSTAKDGDTGTKTTVFPLVRLAGGEYFTFVQNQSVKKNLNAATNVSGTHLIEFPTSDLNISYYLNETMDGYTLWLNGSSLSDMATENAKQQVYDYLDGQVKWRLGINAIVNTSVTLSWVAPHADHIALSNNKNQLGVMVLQEQDNATTKDAILIGLTYTSTDKLCIAAPLTLGLTGVYKSGTRSSDTYVTDYLNTYGTQVMSRSASNAGGEAVIQYPDDQGVITVAFGADPQFSTTVTGGTYDAAYQITSPVTLLDNEVTASSALSDDLILIGGPCANTVVAALITETCDAWPYTTGLIREVANAFSSGQKALIIAGSTADDTRNLAALVMGGTMSYAT